jgi:hypothetical protein
LAKGGLGIVWEDASFTEALFTEDAHTGGSVLNFSDKMDPVGVMASVLKK